MSAQGFDLGDLIAGSPDMAWLDDAACGHLGPEDLSMYFVDAGKAISKDALELCRKCPVRKDCLDHAYTYEATSGYFGGMSPSRRRSLTHEQALAELGLA